MHTNTKELDELTLEELWELFPIFLVEPNPKWHEFNHEMELKIKDILTPDIVCRISHIGSTAINGIWSKNIVDVLVEINETYLIDDVIQVLNKNGMILMNKSNKRDSLNLGYTKYGFEEKVYHIHVRYKNDHDELYFRDYLNEHEDVRETYEKLKLSLWKSYEKNRDAYTNAKSDFVNKYTELAKKLYQNKYFI